MKRRSHVTFILDYIEPNIELPYKLSDSHILRKATIEEIKVIKNRLNRFQVMNDTTEFLSKINLAEIYQYKIEQNVRNEIIYTEIENREDWKYFVVETIGKSISFSEITEAFYLSKKMFNACLSFIINLESQKSNNGKGFDTEIFNFYTNLQHKTSYFDSISKIVKIIDEEVCNEISSILGSIQKNRSHDNINDVLFSLREIHFGNFHSKTRILHYFTLWEQLLAHKPRGDGDSINKQLSNKIILLNNRSEDYKISISEILDSEIDIKKLIGKLYSIRSSVIHTGKLNLNAKENSIFKNKLELVEQCLVVITRLIIIKALEEPELIKDLKEC